MYITNVKNLKLLMKYIINSKWVNQNRQLKRQIKMKKRICTYHNNTSYNEHI